MLVLLLACAVAPAPGEDLCARPDAFTGEVTGSWSGDGQDLSFDAPGGAGWSDGCYGGAIEPPWEAVDGAFDWPATFFVGAGSPEQRPIRAVGCVAGDWLDLSIVEEDGTLFWGPWRMERQDEHIAISNCD